MYAAFDTIKNFLFINFHSAKYNKTSQQLVTIRRQQKNTSGKQYKALTSNTFRVNNDKRSNSIITGMYKLQFLLQFNIIDSTVKLGYRHIELQQLSNNKLFHTLWMNL